jgi:hypothetical protein
MAFRVGKTTQETHPALPKDRRMHEEISRTMVEKLIVDPGNSIKARGIF